MKNIILIVIALILLSSCVSKEGIQTETNENCEVKILPEKELTKLMSNKDFMGIQFVDIRTPHQFAMGHLPNAINVPMKNFFDKSRFKNISDDDMVIIYGEDATSPKIVALLSSHFKKGEFHTISGGYPYLKERFIDEKKEILVQYDDEIPLVDYQKEIDRIKLESGASISATPKKTKKTTKPIVPRKKKEVSGGCG